MLRATVLLLLASAATCSGCVTTTSLEERLAPLEARLDELVEREDAELRNLQRQLDNFESRVDRVQRLGPRVDQLTKDVQETRVAQDSIRTRWAAFSAAIAAAAEELEEAPSSAVSPARYRND